MSKLLQKEDLTLSHKDVEVLELAPCERSNGIFVNEVFNNATARIENPFKAIVIDKGSDMKKGAKLYQEKNPETLIIHDISHILSNVMEKILRDDHVWIAYNKELTLTRHRVQQTEFAALMPPTLRKDARFMDISGIVFWPEKIKDKRKKGVLKGISEKRFDEYLGWIKKYKKSLVEWDLMVRSGEMIKEIIRENLLSHGVYEYIEGVFKAFNLKGKMILAFISEALKQVYQEVEKLGLNEQILASTEVLESIYGKYKYINVGSEQGISGNVLGMCNFIGPEIAEENVLKNMESTSTKTMLKWVSEKVSASIGSLRKRFQIRTKFVKIIDV